MDEEWKQLEDDCFNYIKNTFKTDLTITKMGGSDSTGSDILFSNLTEKFGLEVKSPESQCGQFVLIPNFDEKEFVYSSRNKTPFFSATQKIQDYMNNNFSYFSGVENKPLDINLDPSIFCSWIIDYCKFKEVRFFMTKFIDNHIVFPTEKLEDYFHISASYRQKKSGSRKFTKKYIKELETVLTDKKIDFELQYNQNDKEFTLISNSIKDKDKIKGEINTFYFREINESNYKIRILSKTSNPNVIFKLKLYNKTQDVNDYIKFANALLSQ